MKFTVIVPVYNEIKNIEHVLNSLYTQTRKPDEIIVVDGWSKDWTYEFLKNEEKKWKIKLLQNNVRHWNIARSRNLAIKNSSNDLILCTDAWCEVAKNWCESYLEMYESSDEKIIWWKNENIINTDFQKNCTYRLTSKVRNYPSRNISYLKSVWKDVWWYPEFLTLRWEDTYFNARIREKWYKIAYCEWAMVKWWLRENYWQIYKMYRNYTQWDAEVLVIKKLVQSISIKQALIFSAMFLVFLWLIPVLKWYSLLLLLTGILLIGIYKRTKWGFIFDTLFSCAKIAGITVWFRKWIFKWLKIKYRLRKWILR